MRKVEKISADDPIKQISLEAEKFFRAQKICGTK